MRFSKITISVVAFVCVVFVAIPAAQAATITVTSDSGGTGGPDCKVRDAITAANTDTATGGCPAGSGADVIELPAGVTITLPNVYDSGIGGTGLPPVTSEITINGNGATIRRNFGTGRFRIFLIEDPGNLLLDNLTVTGGFPAQGNGGPYDFSYTGGGILNLEGTLELTHCTVSGNEAGGGGGIFVVGGSLTLTHCTVSGNEAASDGGGIFNFGTNPSTVTNSTISGNSASSVGGGVYNEGGLLSLTHTTVTGNSAGDFAGGILNFGGELTLANSIVANSSSGGDCVGKAGSGVTDNGFNIVEDGSCISAPTSMSGDPNLGPLADNGGPTLTHALLPGSIAIDEIPSENCEVDSDQRGMPRPQGDECDIGSYELEFCPADFDGDGAVGASDLAQLLGSWGPYEPCPPFDAADFNDDCAVNAADLAQLLGSWGPCE